MQSIGVYNSKEAHQPSMNRDQSNIKICMKFMIKRLLEAAIECPSPWKCINILCHGFDLVHMCKQPNHRIPESQTQTAAISPFVCPKRI